MDVRIGITTSFNDGEQRLHHGYVQAVERAGGVPLIVPMVETTKALHEFVGLLHGLVITGGPAITEGLVGDLPDDLNHTDPVRVRSDVAVLRAFLEAKRPVLGICYGMQLLNSVRGGTIHADVEKGVPGALAHSENRGGTVHSIDVDEASLLYRLLERRRLEVNTRHVQAVASVAAPFRIAARASDGVIEAIESEDGTLLGVQFHPERMGDEMQPLFLHLVDRAREFAVINERGT